MQTYDFVNILVGFYFVNAVFTFRFQRTTLEIARKLSNGADRKTIGAYQILMTPIWMGALGWIHTALMIVLPLVLWWQYSWIHALGFLVIGTAGLAIFASILPLPTPAFCLRLIMSEIDKGIAAGNVAALMIKSDVLRIRQEVGD